MPRNEETTTKFKVDISELKKAMQDAKRQISIANSEFKAVSSSMDNWSKSTDGISAKLKQLDSNLKSQKTVLSSLEKQYELTVNEMGEGSAEADRLKVAINNQKAVINNTEREISNFEKSLEKVAEAEKIAAKTGKSVEEVLGEMDDAAKKSGDSMGKLSDGFTVMKGALANLVASGISAAIGALKDMATSVITVGSNFSSSMAEVQAISGASAEELEQLEKTAREFGATTTFSASEAADALKYMALAGWSVDESTSALGGVLNLAAASGMDLAAASDMVTDYLSAFSMEAKDSAYFADMLAYAQSNSNTSAEQLGEAYKNCAANLNAAGQDVETTTALLASMANQGLKGSEAGTALTAVVRDMTAKMDDGKIAIGDTNVQVMDAQGNFRDLTDILFDVEQATQGMGDAEKATALMSTFTSDSIKGLNLILNDGVVNAAQFEDALRGSSVTLAGLEAAAKDANFPLDEMKAAFESAGVSSEDFADILKYSKDAELFAEGLGEACDAGYNADDILSELGITTNDLQSVMTNAAGTAENMAAIMNDNLAGDVKQFQSAIEEVGLKIYDVFEPALRTVVQTAIDLVNGVEGAGSKLGEAVGTVVDTALKKLTEILPEVTQLLSEIINQVLQTILDIAPQLTSIVLELLDSLIAVILSCLPQLITAVLGMAEAILDGLAKALPKIALAIVEVVPKIIDALMKELPTFINACIDFLMAIVEALPTVIQAIVEALPQLITSIITGLLAGVDALTQGYVTLLLTIVDAIPQILPIIVAALPQIINALITGLLTALPQLIQASITLLMALIQAIPVIVVALANAIPQIIDAITDTLLDNFPLILSTAVQVLMAIVQAIPQIIVALAQALPEIISTIMGVIFGLMPQLIQFIAQLLGKIGEWGIQLAVKAGEAALGLINAVIMYISQLPEKIWLWLTNVITILTTWATNLASKGKEAGQKLMESIINKVKEIPAKMRTIGSDIVRGLWDGINDMTEWIASKIKGFCENALDAIKNFFGIASPSKLMAKEVGRWLPEGIAVGIDKNARSVMQSMKDLAMNTVGATRDGLTTGVSNSDMAGGIVYNFYQTNNSPKALSRLDIYRQSKNLLGYVGGGM